MAYDSEHGKIWQDIKAILEKTRVRARKFATDAEWAFGRRPARVLGVVMLFAVVVALLLVFLNWYIAPTKPGDKKDLVLAMAQILAGTALLSGLYFTWRTLQVNREGQITERFTRAIDQLGATDGKGKPRLEIRLGGIYGLERIAKDSPERDYSTIMEVLTAYVRSNAPRSPNEGHKPTSVTNEATERHKDTEQNRPSAAPKPSADIQAVLNVLARYEEDFVPVQSPVRRLNLAGTDLQGAKLYTANLLGTDLQEADLREADLQEANLQGANLQGANLQGANLQGVNLEGANLQGTKLGTYVREGNLRGANLGGANLREANLRRANLQKVNLWKTDLRKANLQETYLWRANLIEANLQEADIQGAMLHETHLQRANLRGADLRGAGLQEANFQGACLLEADLRSTNLDAAINLTQDQISGATVDKTT